MRPTKKRPSIRDVATAAGVSYQTVSRVLNNPELVRPSTRERVEEAIKALGYRRSMVARSLATNNSMLIGVVANQSALVGPAELKLGIDEGALAREYSTVHITIRDSSLDTLEGVFNRLWGLGVDGVIVLAWSQEMVDFAVRLSGMLPTCVVAEGAVPSGLARVHGDQLGGARRAAELMCQAGCKRVGHLAGPDDWLESEARQLGWRLGGGTGACVSAGWEASDGFEAVEELLDIDPSTDGIFAANDHVAVGAIKRLMSMGKRVPEDVIVVGFDDVSLGPYLSVPLTSVQQPFSEIGEAAVRLIFDLIDGGEPSDQVIDTELIVRESTLR